MFTLPPYVCRITANCKKNRPICHRAKARAAAKAPFPTVRQETEQIPAIPAESKRQIQEGSRQSFPNRRVYQTKEKTAARTMKVHPRHMAASRTGLWVGQASR